MLNDVTDGPDFTTEVSAIIFSEVMGKTDICWLLNLYLHVLLTGG